MMRDKIAYLFIGTVFAFSVPAIGNVYNPVAVGGPFVCSSIGGIVWSDGSTLQCGPAITDASGNITIAANRAIFIGPTGSGNNIALGSNQQGDITSFATGRIGFTSSTNAGTAPDTYWMRNSAGVMGLYTTGAAAGTFASGTNVGVSCSVGTLNPVTAVVTNGIVTHC